MNAQGAFQTVASAALECAARGWHVFPAVIEDGAKKGCVAGKQHGGARWGATTDADTIRAYWEQFPDALLGIATGPESGLFVIEADTAAGHDVDGIANLAALIEEHGPLPDTIEALSPTGSRHAYFAWPEGIGEDELRNSAGQIAPGVDVRAAGGMVIAPPSYRADKGAAYRWKYPPPMFDLGDCPEWLLKRALKRREKQEPGGQAKIDLGGDAWAEAALAGELGKLMAALVGDRNGALNRAAFALGQIVGAGRLDESFVVDRLRAAASAIGLEAAEIEATIASGLDAGKRDPRGPKDEHTSDGAPRPNTPGDAIDLSQDALASDLGARSWDRNARHVAAWGKWLFWTGTNWEVDEKRAHMTRARSFMRTRAEELTDWAERKATKVDAEKGEGEGDRLRRWAREQAKTLRSKNTVAAIEALAQSNPASAARPGDFDRDPLLLGTPGGMVDLRTGVLRIADRSDMVTKLTAIAPAGPGTRPERWLTFLDEIFDGDPELVAFMQRAAGYALTGLTTEHKLLFLYGTGRNGKSVFLNTLTRIWHDYARRAASETFLHTQGDKHATGLAGLQGARLVAGSELPKGKTWDESVIKDLTGGDRMTARFMRGDYFDFDPQLTLMIAGNNQPSFRGIDEAIRARVVLVPFLVTISPERRDKALPDKLMAEGPAILRWAIDGAVQWLDQGLNVPDRVVAASDEYMDDEDTLGQFLADETESDPAAFVTTTDLHQRFTFWCDRQGLRAWTLLTLQKEVKQRGFEDHRRKHGRGFIGLRLS